jgi:hypothetical protein
MVRVLFQNGPEAPEIVLDHQFETKEEAKKQLDWFVENYGTVAGAVAWLEGDEKPKAAAKAADEHAAAEAARADELAETPIADTLVAAEPDPPAKPSRK